MSASLPLEILIPYAKKFEAFFETGTNEGDTVQTAVDAGFQEIYSIEMNKELFEKAQRRFIDRRTISLICAASVSAMDHLLNLLTVPTVFFLDAHPDCDQGPTPIMEELARIVKFQQRHVIFADDMRLMGMGKWTATRADIAQFLLDHDYRVAFLANGHSEDDLLFATRD